MLKVRLTAECTIAIQETLKFKKKINTDIYWYKFRYKKKTKILKKKKDFSICTEVINENTDLNADFDHHTFTGEKKKFCVTDLNII